jgi:hypothetical protein
LTLIRVINTQYISCSFLKKKTFILIQLEKIHKNFITLMSFHYQVDSSASVYIGLFHIIKWNVYLKLSYRFCIEVSFVSEVLLQMRRPWSCQYHLVYCSMKIYLAPFLLDILCSWTCNQPTSTSTVIESWVRSLNSSIMLMKKLINFFFFFEEN